MADYETIMQALRKADAAGNATDAARLADMARAAKASESTAQQEAAAQPDLGRIGAGAAALNSGVMAGFDDEIAAGMLAPIEATKNWAQGDGFSLKDSYTDLQQKFDAEKQTRRDDHPIISGAGEAVGAVGLAGGIAKNIGTVVAKGAIPAMAEGGAYGAVFGAGEAKPGDRAHGALLGATIGGATAGITSKLGGVFANRAARKAANARPSPTDALEQRASVLYDNAHRQGVAVKGAALKKTVDGMRKILGHGAARKKLYAESNDIVDLLDEASNTSSLSLREIDELRQVIGDSISDASRRERKMLFQIKKSLDVFMDKLTPADVTGNAKQANVLIKEARDTYARFSKSEVVDEIFQKALNQSTGFENGLRVHFRALANNPKRFKQFNKVEQDAIHKVVRGGSVENALRAFAWFAPDKTLGAMMAGMTMADGGLGLASGIGATGMVATKAAVKAQMKNVNALTKLVTGLEEVAPEMNALQKLAVGAGAIAGQRISRQPNKLALR